MAQNNQDEYPLNVNQANRRTAQHLPSFFRTDPNKKFLGGTLDPLTQPGKLTRINSYVGRRDIPNYTFDDNYVEEDTNPRQYYQLEPSFIYEDSVTGKVNWYADYIDYMNSLKYFGAVTGNHGKLNKSESYSWDPNIDWDKFINYREYYWLPNGPDPVTIYGEEEAIVLVYNVTSRLDDDNSVYLFSSVVGPVNNTTTTELLTANPRLTLYRGKTYTFNINANGAPFCIKTSPVTGSSYFYNVGVSSQLVQNGKITFTVPFEAPDSLYYLNNNDINSAAILEIADVKDATFLDIDLTIIGKKNVTVMKTDLNPNGFNLINGLKLTFAGKVVPEKYATGNWYVEGVGNSIKLISENDLKTPTTYGTVLETPFDNQPFDSLPWEIADNYSTTKDYIVINRSSRDRNVWARNNLWFHINVINATATANNQTSLFNQEQRAIRPIIEFSPNLKLFKSGQISKLDVDFVDTLETDVFSNIEGSLFSDASGNLKVHIDQTEINEGQRILFLADTDSLVYGRIFKVVKIFNANENKYQISFQTVDDSEPVEGEVVYVTNGVKNKGKSYYFQDGKWSEAQQKTKVNQEPLFDLFDENYNSFSDQTVYPYNNFTGNKIFSYQKGTGTNDTELGFPIVYRSISNIGDIEFSFDLQKQSWTYQENNSLNLVNSYVGFVKKLNDNDTFSYTNGWIRTYKNLEQPVVRILKIDTPTDLISIDVYDNSASVRGLSVRVYVNNKKVDPNTISFVAIEGYYYIKFSKVLNVNDKVVYKVFSNENKNTKGYYEIPHNWQNNPLNETIDSFTFGEVSDHVNSIIDNIITFKGNYPGISNLANLGFISRYGNRFLQHAGSMPLAAFVMTDKHANIIKALRYTAKKYTAFKKEFVRLATHTAHDGTPADIVDAILQDYSYSKYVDLSAFYYSDMVAAGAASVREYVVTDPRLPVFVIDSIFTPMTSSKRQILVYVNNEQLAYGIQYDFDTTDAFVIIKSPLNQGDYIIIKDYSNTDGRSYIPYTPSKLGLYPTYLPRIYIDDTYATPTKVIQGHDGSITLAYNDYRDLLIYELEMRIFNSRKVEYNTSIFNIDDIIGGYYRTTDFSKEEIDSLLISDFLKWNSIADLDLTSNDFYIEENSFTYNYSASTGPDGIYGLSGYWRGVYKHFFDTDRPHTHPWEMQGFVIKPLWWDEIYGPAPYTNENKILWDNIEKGLIADPSNRRVNLRYTRSGLSKYIPVDSDGNLLSPLDSNIAKDFSLVNAKNEYKFGDHAPVETAWRRSSEYPYSVISTICLLRGADFIGKMWDRFTIKRNIAGQIYSTVTGAKIQPSTVAFPNVSKGNPNDLTLPVSVTSGLVNFIEEYLFDAKYTSTTLYKETLKALDAKLAYKIGGFTSKEHINVLLDSRSPNASGTVFLPPENYKIFYNKSFPVSTVTYSGVIVEKVGSSYPLWISGNRYHIGDRVSFQSEIYHCTTNHVSSIDRLLTSVEKFNKDSNYWAKEIIGKIGYKVRGYDSERNYFEVYGYRSTQNDPAMNVGGISESYVNWEESKYYTKGQIIRLGNIGYYRSILSHTSSKDFNSDAVKWAPLSKLPIVGGVSVLRRTRFGTDPIKINYGTIFSTVQEVVDFLLGYEKRLEYLGFSFDDYSKDLDVPLTWVTSAKEFMFWTLQNWSAGSVITLSPSANRIKFFPQIKASVDNTDTDFYDYSIFKADGSPLKADLTDIYREDAGFIIKPSSVTNDGVFHIRANLVYKEHVLLFDNVSIFNDMLYDKVPGYRQGRLKIFGYKTAKWDGSYTSPGFLYDSAEVKNWMPNTDYMIGDIVKFKNYYFTALVKVLDKSDFIYTDWKQLDSAPTAGLISNFDYKIEQFRDFYSLDASMFDTTQESLARHLIGYQPRQYLANIINDEVAQYKFYQGFIKEKGTLNSINKLFDVLRSSGFSSIDIKEEWAFKIGEYGSSDAYTEIEFELDEQKFRHNPQNISLTQNNQTYTDLSVYNIKSSDVSIKPSTYDSNPFNQINIDPTQHNYGVFKYQVAGYVMDSDVDHILINEAALLNYDITLFKEKDKIWLGYTSNNDWNVYEYLNANILIISWTASDNTISLQCNVIPDVSVNDIIVISNLDSINGSYKVQAVYNNIIEIFTFNSTIFTIQDNVTSGVVHVIKSSRFSSLDAVSANRYNNKDIRGEIIWVDSDSSGKWLVFQNQNAFTTSEVPAYYKTVSLENNIENIECGNEVKISKDNKWMFVSTWKFESGRVSVYRRTTDNGIWVWVQNLLLPAEYFENTPSNFKFGISVDTTNDGSIVVVGSIDATSLKTKTLNGVHVGSELGTNSGLATQGVVAVFVYNPVEFMYELDIVIASQDPQANEKFGSKVKISNDGDNIWLFVSSKNYLDDLGRVQIFKKIDNEWSVNYQPMLNFDHRLGGSSPILLTGGMYGHDLVCTDGADIVAVSAPYPSTFTNGGTGAVYIFKRTENIFTLIETIDSTNMNNGVIPNSVYGNTYLNDQDYFGYSLSITADTLFISCPNDDNKGYNVGSVYIFRKTSNTEFNKQYELSQYVLPPIINTNERFGTKLDVNPSNNLLTVSAIGGDTLIPLTFNNYLNRVSPEDIEITGITGTIVSNSSTTTITGIPSTIKLFIGMTLIRTSGNGAFGGITRITDIDSKNNGYRSISINSETNNSKGSITFTAHGIYSSYKLDSNSTKLDTETSFDNNSTVFYDRIDYTGAVYVYNRFDDKFIYGDRLRPVDDLESNDKFGSSVSVTDRTIAVGTPSRAVNGKMYGTVFTFNYTELSWKIKQSQSELVDISKFKKAFIYNSKTNNLIEHLDFYDPAKGRIPAIAEQELKYQTYYDPAVYQYGVASEVSVDESMPWTDEHVGELWWDLTKVKFVWYEQSDLTYKSNNWGRIFTGCTVDIYEWVETTYLPSKWAELADTEQGLALGISGIPKDIDNFTWSSKFKYDSISGTKTTLYYYWVKGKNIVPNIQTRHLSCADVARLILDPKSQGYKYASITGKNTLMLTNIGSKLVDTDVSLNLQFYEVDNTELLTHREYVLIAKDDPYAIIPPSIETKWFDSLVGSNMFGQPLPDLKLNKKQRYGNLNSPRQTWFVNRFEALKQLIEYVNSVLAKNIIIDDINFANLKKNDPIPTLYSGDVDEIVDVFYELKFVGTSKLKTAKLSPLILEGKITAVTIVDEGYGYGRNVVYKIDEFGEPISWYGPNVKILGSGKGAEIRTVINDQGVITEVLVIKPGSGYDDNTTLSIRNYTVLVNNDEEANNAWTLYYWNTTDKEWDRFRTQAYDVTRYWSYKDWYETGYGLSSDIGYQVERTVDLNGLPTLIGDIVKINNVGYGNWLLLERINDSNSLDFTDDYKVVGKQNGTIEFSSKLYNYQTLGFDTNTSFDLSFYDQGPTTEIRIILETLRDTILVNTLRVEYVKMFFNSVYYVLSEQLYTDWCFKTSFLKANHNVGSLKQRITFQSDEVDSYESFMEEAKPYKTKIREWISSYQSLEETNLLVTDFDLPSYYSTANNINRIEQTTLRSDNIVQYPWKNWLDNHTYKITDIVLMDGGDDYTTTPIVIISGGGGSGAKATAYIANRKVYSIVIDDHGYGYTSAPVIFISGGNGNIESKRAKAYAKIGNGLARSTLVGMKFDRYARTYVQTVDKNGENNFSYTDKFKGTGNTKSFKLTYAPEIEKSKFTILVNNLQYYGSQYSVSIIEVEHDTYTALEGYIVFVQAPSFGVDIEITYDKNIKLYSAADRINYAYTPTVGQYGKDLGQLMTGIDYGGVSITSIDFEIGGGWSVLPWDVSSWDNVLSSNDDFAVIYGDTREFTLPFTPAVGETINIYRENPITISSIITDNIDNLMTIPVKDVYNVQLGDTVHVNGVGVVGRVLSIENNIVILDKSVDHNTAKDTVITFTRQITTRLDPDLMDSFIGNGTTNVITIPSGVHLENGFILIFRKSTCDGSILPSDRSVMDTLISGGNLSYSSATGSKPEDIVIDGDQLISSDTSHGPEELVEGQVFDTVSLKVYHTPTTGGPNVYLNNFRGDERTTEYKISQLPGTKDGVLVLVNNVPTDYSINFANKTVILSSPPKLNTQIVIIVFDTAGYDMLDKLTYIGNGTTKEFLTAARYEKDNVSVFATINGIETDATVKTSTKADGVVGNVIVQFNTVPVVGSVIQIMVFSGNIQKYSKVTVDNIPTVAGQRTYVLPSVPANQGPLSSNVLIEVSGEYLTPPDCKNFVYDGNDLTIIDNRYLSGMISYSDINVYRNGIQLIAIQDFTLNSIQNTITLQNGVANNDDEIIVEILKRNDYQIVDNKLILTSNFIILDGRNIKVTTFTNHDIFKIKNSNKGFKFGLGFDMLGYDNFRYDLNSTSTNTSGIFDLPRTVSNTSGVFVVLSRKMLAPNVDFVVLDNRRQIKVKLPDELISSDYIEIITTNENTNIPSFGFRIFKDLLNRTSYKVLDGSKVTTLANDLSISDTSITVSNGTILTDVDNNQNIGNRLPGVIDINGERIEYFVKNGNTISQLRRGTLGTPVNNFVASGTFVYNNGITLTIPYADTETKKTAYGNGLKKVFDLDFIPSKRKNKKTGITIPFTYQGSIPSDYYPCDEIEVFVGGRRLLKDPLTVYDKTLGQDSYKGLADKKIEAEFSVDGTSRSVRLTVAPTAGELVVIISNRGKTWQGMSESLSLAYSSTDIARFLNTTQVDLPK